MGVAVEVSTSTSLRICLRRSLWATPKRCSSSMITSPQVLEPDVPLYEPVGADADVDSPAGQALHHLALLRVGPEPAQDLDGGGIGAEPLGERDVVLLGQHGRWDEHGHLLARHHRLEGGPQGDLRLAVADVAAHQPVHGLRGLHVGLDRCDRGQLVGRLLVREGVVQLGLPRGVGGEAVPVGQLPRGVERQELRGHLPRRPGDPLLGALPLLCAQAGQRRRAVHRRDVGGHAVQVVHGNVQLVALGVQEDQVLGAAAVGGRASGAGEPAYAVLHVHHVVAGGYLFQEGVAPGGGRPPGDAPLLGDAEYLGVAEYGQPAALHGEHEAVAQPGPVGSKRGDGAGRGDRVERSGDVRRDAVLGEYLRQPAGVGGDGHHRPTALGEVAHLLGEAVQPPEERRRGRERQDVNVPVDEVVRPPGQYVEPSPDVTGAALDLRPREVGRGEVQRQLPTQLLDVPELSSPPVGLLGRLRYLRRPVHHDQAVSRDVFQQRAGVEQPGVEAKVLDLVPLSEQSQLLLYPVPRRIGAVGEVDRWLPRVQPVARQGREQGFARRADLDRLDHTRRPLRLRVEQPYRVDLVAPELYAGRPGRSYRIDVEDAAAPADEARRVDRRLEPVAHQAPPVQHLLEVDLVPPGQGVSLRGDGLRRYGPLGDGGGRRHDGRRPPA